MLLGEMAKLESAWYSWLLLVSLGWYFFPQREQKMRCVCTKQLSMSVCSVSQFCSSTKQASRQNGHALLLKYTHNAFFYHTVFQFPSVFETRKNIFTKICCYCALLVQVLWLKVPGPVWGWVVSTASKKLGEETDTSSSE